MLLGNLGAAKNRFAQTLARCDRLTLAVFNRLHDGPGGLLVAHALAGQQSPGHLRVVIGISWLGGVVDAFCQSIARLALDLSALKNILLTAWNAGALPQLPSCAPARLRWRARIFNYHQAREAKKIGPDHAANSIRKYRYPSFPSGDDVHTCVRKRCQNTSL